MITNVEISNYRSIGDKVSLKLGKLTALVGPNGSGKSNVVDALRFVSEALRNGLDAAITKRNGINAIRHWNSGRGGNISIGLQIVHNESEEGSYFLELSAGKDGDYHVSRETGSWNVYRATDAGARILDQEWSFVFDYRNGKLVDGRSQGNIFAPEIDAHSLFFDKYVILNNKNVLSYLLRDIGIYDILPEVFREPQKLSPFSRMTESGDNLSTILKKKHNKSWAPDLLTALGALTGDIDGLRVHQAGDFLITEFRHVVAGIGEREPRRTIWADAGRESTGTLRMAAIISALLQVPSLSLIGIEEPELNIHPGAIPLLYDYLDEATCRSQVVITTHSPELLALLDADDVRVVDRQNGVTTISPIEESQRETVKDRLMTLGDLMRREGLQPEPKNPALANGD